MRDNRDILDKLKWLSADMEDMEVPGDWLLPVNEAHSIIVRMREKLEKLRVENIQMQAALGYAICAEDERHIIPSNPYKCGVCDANRGVHDRIEQLEAALREIAKHSRGGVIDTTEKMDRDEFIGIARAALEEK